MIRCFGDHYSEDWWYSKLVIVTPASWKFPDPPNVAVITTRSVVERGSPILLVCHDADDGCWQFHSGDNAEVGDAMVLALSELVELDPSVEDLADPPRGWVARRSTPAAGWTRSPRS